MEKKCQVPVDAAQQQSFNDQDLGVLTEGANLPEQEHSNTMLLLLLKLRRQP